MDRLMAQVARIAADRATRIADRLEEAARAELPTDVTVRKDGEALIIEGKALARRALTVAALRGLTVLARAMLK